MALRDVFSMLSFKAAQLEWPYTRAVMSLAMRPRSFGRSAARTEDSVKRSNRLAAWRGRLLSEVKLSCIVRTTLKTHTREDWPTRDREGFVAARAKRLGGRALTNVRR